MTRAQAIKRLQRLYGTQYCYRVNPGAADADRRDKALAALRQLRDELTAIEGALNTRRHELLDADPHYCALEAKRNTLRKRKDRVLGEAGSYRFQAGYLSELGFAHIEAQGDTWEEVFAILEKKAS